MPAVFHTRHDVAVRTADGRNVTLLEPVEVVTDTGERYRAPEGTQSDGASTPAAMWDSLPPFGPYWLAAVVHDAAYRGTLERQNPDGTWMRVTMPREWCDRLLLDLMAALQVPAAAKEMIYTGVRCGGWKAFRDDRATPLPAP